MDVTLVGSPKKKKTLVGWMCARHEPHTCNTDGGWCVFCVYSTAKESEIVLFTQQQHMHNCTFYSLKVLPCIYPCVVWQRELMCGVFLSMRKMWMRSERPGKWRGLCLDSDVSAALASVAHLIWSQRKKKVLWSCSPGWTHRGHTHTHTDRRRHVLLNYRICMARAGLWRNNGFTDSCCRPIAKLPLTGHALSHTRRHGSNFRQTMELLL